jgi:hypothetical protein
MDPSRKGGDPLLQGLESVGIVERIGEKGDG